MIIVVDSDGVVGSLNSEDLHFLAANSLINKLVKEQKAKFIYPVTTLVESITLLNGRLNKPKLAEELKNLVKTNQLQIEPIDTNLLKQAISQLNLGSSKHHTAFDAIVLAVAQKYQADAIFSFDGFYKKKGFKLASELI